jgi:hypothetical protein
VVELLTVRQASISEYLPRIFVCSNISLQLTPFSLLFVLLIKVAMSSNGSNVSMKVGDDEPDDWFAVWIPFSGLKLTQVAQGQANIQYWMLRSIFSSHLLFSYVYLRDKAENMKLTDCYFEKKDWRACQKEVRLFYILAVKCGYMYSNDII